MATAPDATDFVFRVLEGPRTGQTIALSGRSMPYRAGAGGSVSFGREQRTKLTWYPGNPTATQQVIGPTIKPTTINGIWKDRYLGEGEAARLVELFEEISAQGVQVQVMWEFRLYRGVVKSFGWNPGDPVGGRGDIRWEMTLEWRLVGTSPTWKVGRSGDAGLRSSLFNTTDALAGLGQAILDLKEGIEFFVGQVKTGTKSIVVDLEEVAERLIQPTQTLATNTGTLGTVATVPARIAQDSSAAAADGIEWAGASAETIASIFPAEARVSDDADVFLLAALDRYSGIDVAYDAVYQAFLARIMLEDIVRPPAFTSVVPIVGSDLRELAIRFYGSADLWTRIARQNGLETSKVPDGIEEIIIPLALPDATDPSVT